MAEQRTHSKGASTQTEELSCQHETGVIDGLVYLEELSVEFA